MSLSRDANALCGRSIYEHVMVPDHSRERVAMMIYSPFTGNRRGMGEETKLEPLAQRFRTET